MTLDEIKAARQSIVDSFNGQAPSWFTNMRVSKSEDNYSLCITVPNENSITIAQQYFIDNNITVQCTFIIS